MKSLSFFLFFSLMMFSGLSQVVAVRLTVTVPLPDTSKAGVFVAGSFNYWHAGDSLYKMNRTGEGMYSIILPLFDSKKYEYKYTTGSWDKVELDERDSNIHNRRFISANNKSIFDTVIKWKQPSPVLKPPAQLQKINEMKDSTLARIKPELNNMLELLKSYVANLLKGRPSKSEHRRLDRKAAKKINFAYGEISKLLWNVMITLSPDQKIALKNALEQPEGKQDFLNTFSNSLNKVIEQKK